MKTKLNLMAKDGGPFNCMPAREVELPDERILCNDVVLPWETNYHNVRLWVIGNEYGAIAAVWAEGAQDAFDALVDEGLGDTFLVPQEDQDEATEEEREEWAHLGNAGEACDLSNAWIQQVRLDAAQDCELLCAFAEARGAQQTTLEK